MMQNRAVFSWAENGVLMDALENVTVLIQYFISPKFSGMFLDSSYKG